ncbi:hypothetical protein R3P38DRAFT_1845059 [Favolaschia claudopus]|uniref:F-box domain-containing protein n=1 Tax=Favolaschia claudopus TaxID=2862362 RepID=A0AAW0A354_9AGAR
MQCSTRWRVCRWELQSKIFVHCLRFDEYEGALRPDPKLAPLLVSNVCHLWRDIALCTPELWAPLRMEGSPRGANCSQLYGIWLQRSHPFPVSLTLEYHSELAEGVGHLIDWSARRVEEVSLLLLADPHDEYRIPQLPFQSLKRLNITVLDQKPFNVYDWIHSMLMSPGLLYCTFSASFSQYVVGGDFMPFTLAALKELRLKKRPSSFQVLANPTILLRYLTLPALESLHIHCSITLPNAVSDFSDFIVRSSPPLRSLVIDPVDLVRHPTAEYLSAVPTLETLTLSTSDWVSVLDRLATDPAFLPNLEHLTCTLKRIQPRGDFEVVVRMLNVRSLKMFRLHITISLALELLGRRAVGLDDGILVELQRIRDRGVDIYVGDGQRNYL